MFDGLIQELQSFRNFNQVILAIDP